VAADNIVCRIVDRSQVRTIYGLQEINDTARIFAVDIVLVFVHEAHAGLVSEAHLLPHQRHYLIA
jgi:hypothetical protein